MFIHCIAVQSATLVPNGDGRRTIGCGQIKLGLRAVATADSGAIGIGPNECVGVCDRCGGMHLGRVDRSMVGILVQPCSMGWRVAQCGHPPAGDAGSVAGILFFTEKIDINCDVCVANHVLC